MILAFCVKEPNGDSELDDRFGRAEYFLVVNSNTGANVAFTNASKEASGSAGIKSVQMLKDQRVQALIAPKLGPKALDAAKALGLEVFEQGDSADVDQALTAWDEGRLVKVL